MFTKCQNRKSFIYNKLRDFRESLQADPIFFPVARHGPQLFSKIPAIKQEDAKGHFVLHRRLAQRNAEVDFGTKLLMELLKVWIFQQEGINFLMESCPFLLGRWDGAARKVFLDGYALKAGQLTYDCRYSTMHGMPVTGGRGFRGLKPLWYNGVPP